jgi:hypothetical protein
MERARRIWPAMQSPPRCSVAVFSQGDFIAPVVGVSRTNLRFPKILLPIPESGLVGCAVVLRASGGASAIALIGSGSGSALNIVIALAPAISPHTTPINVKCAAMADSAKLSIEAVKPDKPRVMGLLIVPRW